MIRMPLRNSTSDKIVIAASKCLFFACERHFSIVPLGNIAKVVSGGTPSTDNPFYWDGDIVWTTPKDLGQRHDIEISNSERYISHEGLANSSAKLLPIGTVLLSSRAPIGHLGIASVPLATNQGFKNIICSNQLNNRYLFHMLRANIDKLESLGRGNTFKEIPSRVVEELSLPLPSVDIQQKIADFLDCVYKRLDHQSVSLPMLSSPIEEQRRIVARIEELAVKIEEARGLRREAVEEAEKLYAGILGQEYDMAGSELGGFERLEDLCTKITDGTHVTPTYVLEGVPFLSVKDITSGQINFENTRLISEEEHNFFAQRCNPERDDVLLTKIGTTGIAKAIDVDREFSIFVSLALLKLDKKRLIPKYTEYMLNSPRLKAYSEAGTRGVGNKNLVLKFIKDFPMPAPSLTYQNQVVVRLDNLQIKLNSLKQQQSQTSAELNALLPSILDKAFKGEL